MAKSTLNEIDRLEGIAQACQRGRPIVPMTGVLEDISDARIISNEVGEYDKLLEGTREDIAAAKEDLRALRDDEAEFVGAQSEAQALLDKLMASLSARLER